MKSIVTGAAGFIGSNLALRLLERGEEVIGIDSLTDYYSPLEKLERIRILETHGGFTFQQQDICAADLHALMDGASVIYHQAGQPGVRKSWGREFGEYIERNIDATQKLLEAARQSKTLGKFVYASSSSIYGNARSYPTSEQTIPQPVSPYGVTKLAAEHLCSLYAANFEVPTVSLRYFTAYGPGQRPDMAFRRFISAALQGRAIDVFGDGSQTRDFTFVDDVAEANIAAAQTDLEPGAIFNVASGNTISVNEVLDIIQGVIGETLDIRRSAPVYGDVDRTCGDGSEIMRRTDWRPGVTVEEGLTRQVAWQRENIDKGP